jgi:Leucine rich repeat
MQAADDLSKDAAKQETGDHFSMHQTPTFDSQTTATLVAERDPVAPISKGMTSVGVKMQVLGGRGGNILRHDCGTRKPVEIESPPRAHTIIQRSDSSMAFNGAHLTSKMQMSSGETQQGRWGREEMKLSEGDATQQHDRPCFSSAIGGNRSNTSGKVSCSKINSRASLETGRPGAFRLAPGLPPIPAGDVGIEDETETSLNEKKAGQKQVVVEATLVEQNRQGESTDTLELQHAAEAVPAELSVVTFRRRAFSLVTVVVLAVVASTITVAIVANKPTHVPIPFRNLTFEEFVDTLLPIESREQAAADSSSPQQQALEWLKRDTRGLTVVGCRLLQRYSLSVVYFSLNGHGWTNQTGWLSAGDECLWNPELAACDDKGRTSGLKLSENNLTGTIPHELSLLTALETIYIDGNRVIGTIPKSILALSQLARLDCGENQLSGTLPTELGGLPSLKSLVLRKNRLNGTIPSELGMLSLLTLFRIDGNELEGSLPTTLGLMGKLETFFADFNTLTGSIPTEVGRMSSLVGLAFDNNQLSGSIPTELGRLQRLEVVYMTRNIGIRGTLPSELGLLASLLDLFLDRTSISGTIPSEL